MRAHVSIYAQQLYLYVRYEAESLLFDRIETNFILLENRAAWRSDEREKSGKKFGEKPQPKKMHKEKPKTVKRCTRLA